ncbi:MAG: translocation/assembly module TamB domain-containing protein, partial [Candidatus Krumholzibacteria bacterium]|nr:translocation/assembly module TamB domain-containing protein [Candidatus Krumholzibacteria bacterium]
INLDLTPILSAVGKGPFSGGIFNGTISISDSLVFPIVVLEGNVHELVVRQFRIPPVNLSLMVGKSELDLYGTVDISPDHRGSFSGVIPLVYDDWFYSIDRHRPLSLQLNIPKGDFGSITGMTNILAEAAGRFSASFVVSGSANRPNIVGELELSDTSFRLSGMEENFYDVNSRIDLDDSLITITELRGKEGKDGKFRCIGWIALAGWKPDRYNLTARLDEFLLASIPDIVSILSGELNIDTMVENDRVIPIVSGLLEVKRAEIYYDLGDFASASRTGTMESPSWIAAVDLKVPGNAWLKTPDAKVELRGEVTVHHDHKGTYLRGELNLLRGWYNVYNNKFHVKSGKLDFVQAEGFRPVVDIDAETRDPEGRKIYLNLSWHQDDVEPKLSLYHEDPGYSETDIWKMLGGGVIGSAGGERASWDALSTAQNLAANYIERLLNSQMEGMTIELESMRSSGLAGGAFGEKETMIAVGKYLSESLYVKYKQGLSISTARHIEVEYRLSDLFLLRSEIIKYSQKALKQKSPGSTDEINVDIKLRWEF